MFLEEAQWQAALSGGVIVQVSPFAAPEESPYPLPPPQAGAGAENPPSLAGEGGARAKGAGGWGLSDEAFDAGARPAKSFASERADGRINLFDAVRDYLAGEPQAGRRAAIAAYSEGSADRLPPGFQERGVARLR